MAPANERNGVSTSETVKEYNLLGFCGEQNCHGERPHTRAACRYPEKWAALPPDQGPDKCEKCGHAAHVKPCSAQLFPDVFCYCGVEAQPSPTLEPRCPECKSEYQSLMLNGCRNKWHGVASEIASKGEHDHSLSPAAPDPLEKLAEQCAKDCWQAMRYKHGNWQAIAKGADIILSALREATKVQSDFSNAAAEQAYKIREEYRHYAEHATEELARLQAQLEAAQQAESDELKACREQLIMAHEEMSDLINQRDKYALVLREIVTMPLSRSGLVKKARAALSAGSASTEKKND